MPRRIKETSPETRDEALRLARANQRPGQTKDQTRLIAQGIEKGIAQYKKQQKAKARDADRAAKKQRRAVHEPQQVDALPAPSPSSRSWLPWTLLLLSWAGFAAYLALAG